jgi:hypothetical protein
MGQRVRTVTGGQGASPSIREVPRALGVKDAAREGRTPSAPAPSGAGRAACSQCDDSHAAGVCGGGGGNAVPAAHLTERGLLWPPTHTHPVALLTTPMPPDDLRLLRCVPRACLPITRARLFCSPGKDGGKAKPLKAAKVRVVLGWRREAALLRRGASWMCCTLVPCRRRRRTCLPKTLRSRRSRRPRRRHLPRLPKSSERSEAWTSRRRGRELSASSIQGQAAAP